MDLEDRIIGQITELEAALEAEQARTEGLRKNSMYAVQQVRELEQQLAASQVECEELKYIVAAKAERNIYLLGRLKNMADKYYEYKAALTAECERLRERARWIPVEERLPDSSGNHLIFANNVVYVAYYFAVNKQWTHGYYKNSVCPTHWRELPEPPKEAE